MHQKESIHKTDQEQALQDLWLKECAEFDELQKIKIADVFERFTTCFKLRKWNSKRFVENTELSETIYSKIKNKTYKEGQFPSLESIVAICIGLQIPFEFSRTLLEKCGHSLTDQERDRCYRHILTHYEIFNIDKANRFLIQDGFKPISGLDLYKKKISHREKGVLPEKSLNNYPLGNCAEVDAINQALNSGAKLKNITIYTIHATKGNIGRRKEACENCTFAFKGKIKKNHTGWKAKGK